MRDINRIDPFLKELGEVWRTCPDMRFGQLISCLIPRQDSENLKSILWNWEEDNWTKALKQFADRQ